jgi:hypothetical protein
MPREIPLASGLVPVVVARLVHLDPAMHRVAQGWGQHHERVIVGMKLHIVQRGSGAEGCAAAMVTEPPLPKRGRNEDG